PLVGPASDDRLAGRMARGVVVVAALRGAFGVAARPGGYIDRKDQRVGVGQGGDQQGAQPLGIDPPAGERVIGAAPAAPVSWLEAEMGHRGTAGAHSSASVRSNRASARRV